MYNSESCVSVKYYNDMNPYGKDGVSPDITNIAVRILIRGEVAVTNVGTYLALAPALAFAAVLAFALAFAAALAFALAFAAALTLLSP